MATGADSITPDEIEACFREEDWTSATANRYRALLSLIYRLAIRNRKVLGNPAHLVAHRHEDNIRIRFLSPDEEKALRKAIQAHWPERMPELELALQTGLRLGEQYSLSWEDVDWERRILTVACSKNGAMRHVPLNGSAIQTLCRLREMHSDSPFVCGGWKTPREGFSLAVQRVEVKNFTWHCLRHTYASRLVMAGVDLRTVAELLGHRTLAMVMRYAHLAPDYQRAAVERMDLIFTKRTDTRTDTDSLASSAVVH